MARHGPIRAQTCRLYDVRRNVSLATFNHSGALLDCCFSDAMHAFRSVQFVCVAPLTLRSGGIENNVYAFGAHSHNSSDDRNRYDLGSSQQSVLGTHEAPVRSVAFAPSAGVLVSGSWDRTVKLWDVRSGQLVAQGNQPDKVPLTTHWHCAHSGRSSPWRCRATA